MKPPATALIFMRNNFENRQIGGKLLSCILLGVDILENGKFSKNICTCLSKVYKFCKNIKSRKKFAAVHILSRRTLKQFYAMHKFRHKRLKKF